MGDGSEHFADLLERIKGLVQRPDGRDAALGAVCELLAGAVPHYDWVGFYLVDESGENLALGPFAGEPTEHVTIPFGKGICGQAAARGETFVVQDVTKEPNYLSCSLKTKSEIVVPLFKDGRLVGELDIDSHHLAPFTDADRKFLEAVSEVAAEII